MYGVSDTVGDKRWQANACMYLLAEICPLVRCRCAVFNLQMLREMQDEQRAMNNNPAEMQAQAHASAVKRFTGGGFAVN